MRQLLQHFRTVAKVKAAHFGELAAMDFNHPFAGMTVDFDGEIIEVRDATEEELHPKHGCGCGCSHHGGCDDGCGCHGDEGGKEGCGCGDGCGCH